MIWDKGNQAGVHDWKDRSMRNMQWRKNMGKKVSAIFLVMVALVMGLSAGVSETFSDVDEFATTKPSVVVNLPLGADGSGEFEIGFAKAPVANGSIKQEVSKHSGIVTLDIQGGKGVLSTAEDAEDLYVYWQITGGVPVTISMYQDGALDTGTVEDGSLNWQVGWTPVKTTTGSIHADETKVTIGGDSGSPSYGEASAKPIYTRESGFNLVDVGSVQITSIETGDISKAGVKLDKTYSANLYIKVVDNSV